MGQLRREEGEALKEASRTPSNQEASPRGHAPSKLHLVERLGVGRQKAKRNPPEVKGDR